MSTDRNIVQEYVNHLNEVCNVTITDCHLVVINSIQQPDRFIISCYQNGVFLPLTLKPSGCLSFWQEVSVSSGKILVENYVYRYYTSPNTNDEQQLFRYEYSLNPDDNKPHAHLHINVKGGGKNLKRYHFPTGSRLSIEQVIAHLIMEHKIEPKCTSWLEVLAISHHEFLKIRNEPTLFP